MSYYRNVTFLQSKNVSEFKVKLSGLHCGIQYPVAGCSDVQCTCCQMYEVKNVHVTHSVNMHNILQR